MKEYNRKGVAFFIFVAIVSFLTLFIGLEPLHGFNMALLFALIPSSASGILAVIAGKYPR